MHLSLYVSHQLYLTHVLFRVIKLKVNQMGRVELELGNLLNQSQVILPQKLMNKPIILQFESKGKYKTIKHIFTNQIIYDEK